jgi:hypothetical protein
MVIPKKQEGKKARRPGSKKELLHGSEPRSPVRLESSLQPQVESRPAPVGHRRTRSSFER